MKIEQIYTGCLSHGAYYIESEGEAVIIDPLRDADTYIQKAKKDKARIKYIFETHFHADFVSGHLDLANKTGATIVYGPGAKPSFPAHIARDGEELNAGKLIFKVLHTPGHTMESVCYLLRDERGKDIALFSGDTLFIGDVGRPDLAQKAANMTKEELAATLFDSLRYKIMPLNDTIIVYPAHGAGSACGKNMSTETSDTLGHQKLTNYALRSDMTKEEFIREVTNGLLPPPAYFPANVAMNKQGYESIEKVLTRGNTALDPLNFEIVADMSEALILDTRDPQLFAQGFIPNSINIGIDGNFAPWAGAMIPDTDQTIVLVADTGREEEVITRLARVGYDHTVGYLQGGIEAWKKAGRETDQILSISAQDLASIMEKGKNIKLVDVRRQSEYKLCHPANADNIPLDYLNDCWHTIDKNETAYIYCAGGYRSMIFISILRARGYNRLINVQGGFKAMKETGKIVMSSTV
jgi:hydroxyacylglutathione hydrolase